MHNKKNRLPSSLFCSSFSLSVTFNASKLFQNLLSGSLPHYPFDPLKEYLKIMYPMSTFHYRRQFWICLPPNKIFQLKHIPNIRTANLYYNFSSRIFFNVSPYGFPFPKSRVVPNTKPFTPFGAYSRILSAPQAPSQ